MGILDKYISKGVMEAIVFPEIEKTKKEVEEFVDNIDEEKIIKLFLKAGITKLLKG